MSTVLEIEGRADLNAAAADVADLGAASRDLAGDIDKAGAAARGAGGDLSGLGDGSDELASKSSQATGALGALAGGLEAVGLEKYAAGLQGAAIATDVMSGAGDALNLVAETAAGRWIVTTAQTVAHTVATGAQAVATGAMTAAQGALNIVMAANPILLVVIAVGLLVGGLILAYKHSESFRNIVDAAFSKAKEVAEFAADAISGFIGWLEDLPGKARDAWDAVHDAITDKIGDAKDFVDDFIDGIESGVSGIVSGVAGSFTSMFAPIQTAIDWVQDLIDKIANIDLPDINPFDSRNAIAGAGGKPTAGGDTGTPSPEFPPVLLELTAAPQDKDKATADMVDALREYFARRGQTLSITSRTP